MEAAAGTDTDAPAKASCPGVQTGILGMDGSQGLMLLRQLTLLRNDGTGTLISQQPCLISKLLLTSCKLAADEVQLLSD